MDNNKCKGCLLKHDGRYKCIMDIHPLFEESPCPCQTCLLKCMCQSVCNLFVNFVRNRLLVIHPDNLQLERRIETVFGSEFNRTDCLAYLQFYYEKEPQYLNYGLIPQTAVKPKLIVFYLESEYD